MSVRTDSQQRAVRLVTEELRKALAARKCHPCGCLHGTLTALEGTDVGRSELAGLLREVRAVVAEAQYDCLGCAICYPAVASNAAAEAFAEAAETLVACPTDRPVQRTGWPPLPGDYRVIRYTAPVAVCTLNSADLADRLAKRVLDGVALIGTLHTENLGIERIIRNVSANPHIRFLVVAGEDTRQAIGHLPGQSLASLFENGIDERGRIRGARGKRPVLKNVGADEVNAFRQQVEPLVLIGEEREDVIVEKIGKAQGRNPGAFRGAPTVARVEVVSAQEPSRLIPDPAGFLVVFPDVERHRLIVEHYSVDGILTCILEGRTPAAVYAEAIERKLLSRFDHAAYLGRELALAERSLTTGERYVQDRAPGEMPADDSRACSCRTAGESDCGTPK